VKSAAMKFGNDQNFCVRHFDETSGWMGWPENEFSHSLSLQATATAPVSRTGVGNLIVALAFRSQSPVAVPELRR